MKSSRTPSDERSAPTDSATDSATLQASTATLPATPLPDQISQNIEVIVALQTKAHRNLPQQQRTVEAVTAFFSRPTFLYGILLVAALWVLPNVLPQRFGVRPFDPPPFYALQGVVSFSALLIATGVLIKQTRQEQLAEQRAQLILQINLLSEQKIVKLMALLEELRCDLPHVADRHDPEVELLKQAIDPHLIVDRLEERLEEELAELQEQDQGGAAPVEAPWSCSWVTVRIRTNMGKQPN